MWICYRARSGGRTHGGTNDAFRRVSILMTWFLILHCKTDRPLGEILPDETA